MSIAQVPGSEKCHPLVGPYCLLGLMDEEAKSPFQDGRGETQIFELV